MAMSGFELWSSPHFPLLNYGLYRLRYSYLLVRWYALISDIEIRFHSLCVAGRKRGGGVTPWVSHSIHCEYQTIKSKAAENFIQAIIDWNINCSFLFRSHDWWSSDSDISRTITTTSFFQSIPPSRCSRQQLPPDCCLPLSKRTHSL